jgi:hypothetical protein
MAEATGTPEQGAEGKADGEDTFLGTYGTKEAAEQGLAEKDKTISRQASEIDGLKRNFDALSAQTSALTELAKKDQQPSQTQEKPAMSVEDLTNRLSRALENGETDAAREILALQSAYAADAEQRATEHANAQLKAIEEKYGGKVAELEIRLQDVDPDWVQNREQVQKIAEGIGVELTSENRDIFLKLAKSQNNTDHPDRIAPPAGVSSTVRTVDDGGTSVSAEQEALLKQAGITLSDTEKKALVKG